MSVISRVKNNSLLVYVTGNLQLKEELTQFIRVTSDKFTSMDITFSDAECLPSKAIERLNELVEKHTKENINIYTVKGVLSNYLFKLNIENHNLRQKRSVVNCTSYKEIRALAIGGSSGSIERIKEIIRRLPYVKDLVIFIVQHVREDVPSKLPELYQTYTNFYNVVMPISGTLIQRETIYVAPPACHMVVVGEYIYLTKEKRVYYSRPSIDVLFRSLAIVYENELLAVLLCGYGRDGVDSLKELKRVHSTIIIEEPAECRAPDIPINAIDSGNYDHVLSVEGVVNYIRRCGGERNDISDDELNRFFVSIKETYGYDFTQYYFTSLKRCARRAMIKSQTNSFADYRDRVLNDTDAFKELMFEISINVTTFFRNPNSFRYLRENVIPYLDSYHHINIWCAGCSSGEECYTVAIILKEAGLLHRAHIYATDFNPVVVEQAKNGFYSLENRKINETHYRESGGTGKFKEYFTFYNGYMQVDDELKERVLFFTHNLTTDGVFNEFQLILCRNVLIYFNNTLQDSVLKLFNESLDMSGFLMLGDSESLNNKNNGDKYYIVHNSKYRIFKKRNI
ncbi:MAG: hypothetical protein L3V56_10795 [Candidatus Magnetoovum sp. WYHC-5]|nr:hypothetical protein [Candidatus Magnetoovum sp. WYHC-5]